MAGQATADAQHGGTGRMTEQLKWYRSGKGTLYLKTVKGKRTLGVVYGRGDGTFGWNAGGKADNHPHPTEEDAIEGLYAALRM